MSSSPRFVYPFATSPDVIRSHQKDAYFSAVLLEQLSTLLRKIKGARYAHTYTSETRVFGELLYLGLTTLIGNRTLGEEYCDIIQVEGENGRLPTLGRRAGYILSCILGPYLLGRILPAFRKRIRAKLEANLKKYARQRAKAQHQAKEGGHTKSISTPIGARIQNYLLQNLDTITSPSPVYALSLATFYFAGSYYHLSKRIWNLRYIFTRQVQESDQRMGYEVLGVLLILQMAVQGYLHLQNTMSRDTAQTGAPGTGTGIGTTAIVGGGAEVSLDPNAYSANNALLFDASTGTPTPPTELQKWTNTPMADNPKYELNNDETMAWIGDTNRKCTLCLEGMKDPSVTTCGHVFCWSIIIAESGETRHGCHHRLTADDDDECPKRDDNTGVLLDDDFSKPVNLKAFEISGYEPVVELCPS
ncbi:peroxisome biogenesis factor 10 [Kalmusia sp. IMI 367209]|nr:peroxisome biogenesis factor 10 [Kalmusia sp. IMI 367209]